MKKALFLTLMASVAFAACTSDESLVPPQEIDFQVAKYLSTSRATGSEFTGSFGTYSFGLGDGKEMSNTEIFLQSGVWKAATPYYWPVTGNTVNFISYAPYSATCPFTIADGSVSITSLYTIDGSTDLMLADYATGLTSNVNNITTSGTDYTGVPTLFRHMLSNVSFNIGLTADAVAKGYSLIVTGMELSGIYNQGTISLTPNSGNAVSNLKEWDWPAYWTTTSSTTTDITIGHPTEEITTSDLVAATLQNCYLLPQEFVVDQQQITISYKLKYNGQDEEQDPITKDLLNIATDHTEWGINKKIVYNIRIGVTTNEITFDPAVADWSTPVDVNVTL